MKTMWTLSLVAILAIGLTHQAVTKPEEKKTTGETKPKADSKHLLLVVNQPTNVQPPIAVDPWPQNTQQSSSTDECIADRPCCKYINCPSGTVCRLVQVQCVRFPCYEQPQCLPVSDPWPQTNGQQPVQTQAGVCAELCPPGGCPTGQTCSSNGCGHSCQAIVDPWPQTPTLPTTVRPVFELNLDEACKGVVCPAGQVCKVRKLTCRHIPSCNPKTTCVAASTSAQQTPLVNTAQQNNFPNQFYNGNNNYNYLLPGNYIRPTTNNNFNGYNSASSTGYNGNSASSTGYNGNSASSTGYNGNWASSTGYNGNSASSTGYNGNSATNTGYNGNSASSTGYNGNSASNTGYNGNSASSTGYNGNSASNTGYNGNTAANTGYNSNSASNTGYNGNTAANTGYNTWQTNTNLLSTQQSPLSLVIPVYTSSSQNAGSSNQYNSQSTNQYGNNRYPNTLSNIFPSQNSISISSLLGGALGTGQHTSVLTNKFPNQNSQQSSTVITSQQSGTYNRYPNQNSQYTNNQYGSGSGFTTGSSGNYGQNSQFGSSATNQNAQHTQLGSGYTSGQQTSSLTNQNAQHNQLGSGYTSGQQGSGFGQQGSGFASQQGGAYGQQGSSGFGTSSSTSHSSSSSSNTQQNSNQGSSSGQTSHQSGSQYAYGG